MTGVLSGLTVLDLSRVYAAPFGTQMLADMGATVWKVESLDGDDVRRWGDHAFNAFNRGKLSLAIDLKHPEGARLVQRLATRADVFVENFKVGDLRRYGLDQETLRAADPRLIYLSLTGFGQHGPLHAQPGYDTIMQAMTGIMSVTGEPNEGPTRVGIAWIDLMAGLTATVGILASLQERAKSGFGQYVDLSLYDVGLMALIEAGQAYLQTGIAPTRRGNITRNISPAQLFQVQDGWITLAAGNDRQFHNLCNALGCGGLASDSRFLTNTDRVKHRQVLADLLAEILVHQSRSHWQSVMGEAGVPCGPVMDIGEALRHPQAVQRGAVWHVTGEHGSLPVIANPLRHMSRSAVGPTRSPPRHGEHTAGVLGEVLGLQSEEINSLLAQRVIASGCNSSGAT